MSGGSTSPSLNHLPADLFMDKSIFQNVLSCDLWSEGGLSESKKEDLINKYLPRCLTVQEKHETMKMLLKNTLTRFDEDPLNSVYFHLKLQKLAPDLVKTLEDVKHLKSKALKLNEQRHQCVLLKQVLKKRNQMYEDAINCSSDTFPNSFKRKDQVSTIEDLKSNSAKHKNRYTHLLRCHRVKERYLKELSDLGLLNSKSCDEKMSSDEEEADELGIPFSEVLQNQVKVSSTSSVRTKLNCSYVQKTSIPSEKQYLEMLKKHKRKRKAIEQEATSQVINYDALMDTSNITLSDVIMRVTNFSSDENTTGIKTNNAPDSKGHSVSNSSMKTSKIATQPNSLSSTNKKKSKPNCTFTRIMASPSPQSTLTATIPSPAVEVPKTLEFDSTNIKKEPVDVFDFVDNDSPPQTFPPPPLSLPSSTSTITAPVTSFASLIPQPQSPIIAAPLPALPPLLSSTTTPEPPPFPLTQLENPPACYFSLLRDVFNINAPNDHKLTLHKLEELVKEKLRCFDPKLIWSHETVQSAMNYLSGVLPPPDMIPLVDYKEKNQQWQWIGDGRDSDEILAALCKEWTEEKDKNTSTSLMDPSQPIPGAICPTDWLVRPSTDEEKRIYRDQEALRYNNPYKAFTFRIHGYESVVGPVKGCGIGASTAHSASPNKAREHSLLVNDRPPFVTLLSLVRDAAARLPNGEGTRADICELLKDSQYLLPSVSDQQVNGIVSGALDRLHYEKDPCVKYDVNRKVWIYLHRNRSEKEFERLHEVQVAAAKAKRSLNKVQRRSSSGPSSKISAPTTGPKNIVLKGPKAITQNLLPETSTSPSAQLPSSSPCPFVLTPKTMSVATTSNHEISTTVTGSVTQTVLNSSSSGIPIENVTVIKNKTRSSIQQNSSFTSKKKLNKQKIVKIPEIDIENNDFKPLSPIATVMSPINNSLAIPQIDLTSQSDSNDATSKVTHIKPQKPSRPIKQLPKVPSTKPIITLPQAKQTTTTKFQDSKPLIHLPQSKNQISNIDNLHHILNIAANSAPKTMTTIPSANKVTLPKPQSHQLQIHHQQVHVPKQIQLPVSQAQPTIVSTQCSSTGAPTHQISIPTSVLFGARPGSVVLATPGGKSYMMAASGGSIVLQPNTTAGPNSGLNTTGTNTGSASLAVRTLQGIRVIPVTATTAHRQPAPLLATTQTSGPATTQIGTIPPHQVVARIITTGQPGRGVPQTQIVIPSNSTLQPLLLAQAQQPQNMAGGPNVQSSLQSSLPASIIQNASQQITLPVNSSTIQAATTSKPKNLPTTIVVTTVSSQPTTIISTTSTT